MNQVIDEIVNYLKVACGTNFTTYYLGHPKTEKIPASYLPALSVYGSATTLDTANLSTARDKYQFDVTIKVTVNVYGHVADDEPQNTTDTDIIELQGQKELHQLVEERDADMKPLATTVLGALRANVKGLAYLYNTEIAIDYPEGNIAGTQYLQATIRVANMARYNTR